MTTLDTATSLVRRAHATISSIPADATLFQTLERFERALGSDCLTPNAGLPVRIRASRSLSSPAREVLSIRIIEDQPRGARVEIEAVIPAFAGTLALTTDRIVALLNGDHPAAEFFDLFHHRAAVLLYEAWKWSTWRTTGFADALQDWINARLGEWADLSMIGVASNGPISSETLRGLLSESVDPVPVQVRACVPRRTAFAHEERLTLGSPYSRLGRRGMLGSTATDTFSTLEVVLGPADPERLVPFLAPSKQRERLDQLIAALLPPEAIARITIRLPRPRAPKPLGTQFAAALGRDAYLTGGISHESEVFGGIVNGGTGRVASRVPEMSNRTSANYLAESKNTTRGTLATISDRRRDEHR